MKAIKNLNKFSLVHNLVRILLITSIAILIIITYRSIFSRKLFNETYETNVVDNNIDPIIFFTEYNDQLKGYSLTTIKDYEIKEKKGERIPYQSQGSENSPIDDYHTYAHWKPEADVYPSTNKFFLTIDVYSNAIVYKNFLRTYISENYNIATLKSMRNTLINIGYNCISEKELLDKYTPIKAKTFINGDIDTIEISPNYILSISFDHHVSIYKIVSTNYYNSYQK